MPWTDGALNVQGASHHPNETCVLRDSNLHPSDYQVNTLPLGNGTNQIAVTVDQLFIQNKYYNL